MPTTKNKTKKITNNKKATPAPKKAATKSKVKSVAKKAAAKKAPVTAVEKKSTRPKAVAPKGVSAPPPRKTKESFKKEIVQKLLVVKSKILQEVTQKVRSESDSLKFEIGDIYDIASNERERELSLTLGDRDREKLSEIEDAFERIKDNTYGQCEECGEPVAEDRLRALPFTRVCVECQSRTEREQRIKGRFEEEPGLGILEKSESEEDEY